MVRNGVLGALGLAFAWSCGGQSSSTGGTGASNSVGGNGAAGSPATGGVGGASNIGGTGGTSGTPGTGGAGPGAECFITARCADGVVSYVHSLCTEGTLACELGCRTDITPSTFFTTNYYGTADPDWLRSLCEEFRLEHGPRRPADPCSTDFECLPFPHPGGEVVTASPDATATAWPEVLTCSEGICAEGLREPDDYGSACDSANALSQSESCESGICINVDGNGVCTMRCVVDSDCPAGAACQFVRPRGREVGAGVCAGGEPTGEGGAGGVDSSTCPSGPITALAVGEVYACAVSDGSLCCWGSNYSSTQDPTPTVIETPATFEVVDAKGYGICALSVGRAYCNDGQLSPDGGFTALDDNTDWTWISAFDQNTCGIRGVDLYCRSTSEEELVQHGVGLTWTWVDVGGNLTCGIASGALYCWSRSQEPAPVGTATDWEMVSVGMDVTCGLRGEEIYCFGDNSVGQLGIGDVSIASSDEPLAIALAGPWHEVRTHYSTTCGVRSGEVYCWGRNHLGAAGADEQSPFVASPTRVGSLDDWHSVGVGEAHACALRADGVHCWGSNDSNQFGTTEPDRDFHPEPLPIVLNGD